jgi:hypothetical protein
VRQWTSHLSDKLSVRIDTYAASGAITGKEEFRTLLEGALESNHKSMHMVASSLSAIAKTDDTGKDTQFALEFLSSGKDSCFFLFNWLNLQNGGKDAFTNRDLELIDMKFTGLKDALKTIYLQKRLAPESELWHQVKCDGQKFNAAVERVLPLFNEFTANGKGHLTLIEGIHIFEELGTWKHCSVPDIIIQNEAKNALSKTGDKQFSVVSRLFRLVEIGTRDFGFIFDLYKIKDGEDDDRWLLGAYKIAKIADAPHKVFVEQDSGPVLHNDIIKSNCYGYFTPSKERSIVLNNVLGKRDIIGRFNFPSEICTVPHEMEHSVQHLLGMEIGSDWKEFGAELAALICMGETNANQLLHSWDDRIRRNQTLAKILDNPTVAYLRECAILARTDAKILKEIGKIQDLHPRMPNMKIIRILLDNFYQDELSITHSALEDAAERIIGKTGLD